MDIIKKIFSLKNDQILDQVKNIITQSETCIDRLINEDIEPKIKINMLIQDTYICDTYTSVISLLILICDKSDYHNWIQAEKLFKQHNNSFNTNQELLKIIIELIKQTDDMYDKIFLSKMGRSMEKYGLNTNNSSRIAKILSQIEDTENNIFNILDKPLKIQIDRKNIGARSESIMSSVYPDDSNNIIVNKKKYYYLLKKLTDKNISKELESQYMKRYVDILPLTGKLLILRSIYAKNIGFNNYYELVSEKTEEETEEIQQLITDLNLKLDMPFSNILNDLKRVLKNTKLDFNDIIHALDILSPDIKLSPIEMLQYVMTTIQQKLSIDFKTSKMSALNKNSNCIEVFDRNNNLKGYLHIDLIQRENKRTNQMSVIKLNNQYKNNLPSVYFIGCYTNLEEKYCSYSELVIMFREFGNILINLFAHTPNGINEFDLEIFNFIPDIMEFIAYDDYVLSLVLYNQYGENYHHKMKQIKSIRKIEFIINLKLKCTNALFDNIVHNSSNFINKISKCELDEIKNILLDLNNNIMKDIFGKHDKNLIFIQPYINQTTVNNLINGNQGLIYGSILSIILSFNAYKIIMTNKSKSNEFLFNLLENKNYSYRKLILEFISQLNNDYYNEFLQSCLGIQPDSENYYDEEVTECK
jgi:Zn-dependent oligopeptidase